jgi:hypothetical protein
MSAELSVIIVVGRQRLRAEQCIEALLKQDNPPPMELIVIDVAPEAEPPRWASSATVRHIPRPETESMAEAKAIGARLAHSEFIAFLEDHCHPGPGWASAVRHAFKCDVDVVAYAFKNLNPVNYTSRAFLVLAYGPWLAPAESGPVSSPSWMNVAYRAAVLRRYFDRLPLLFECETLLHKELRLAGSRFWHESAAEVAHLNHPRLRGSCRDSAVWQRLFAAARVSHENWGLPRRLLYAAGSPLSPAVIAWRLGRRMWARPSMRGTFLKSLPLMLAVYSYGSLNESRGYLFGRGNAGRESIEVETADPRAL